MVSLKSNLHFSRDVGQENLVAVEELGLGDVEDIEVQDKVDHPLDGDQVDHKVAHRNHLHIGAGRNRLGDLALRALEKHEDEVRMHNQADGRHQHEDILEEVEVPWHMVEPRPWESE